jgi:hypothetical protein
MSELSMVVSVVGALCVLVLFVIGAYGQEKVTLTVWTHRYYEVAPPSLLHFIAPFVHVSMANGGSSRGLPDF